MSYTESFSCLPIRSHALPTTSATYFLWIAISGLVLMWCSTFSTVESVRGQVMCGPSYPGSIWMSAPQSMLFGERPPEMDSATAELPFGVADEAGW